MAKFLQFKGHVGRRAEQYNEKRGARVETLGGLGTGKIERQNLKERGNLLVVLNQQWAFLQQNSGRGVNTRVQKLAQFNEAGKPFQHLTFLGIERI